MELPQSWVQRRARLRESSRKWASWQLEVISEGVPGHQYRKEGRPRSHHKA